MFMSLTRPYGWPAERLVEALKAAGEPTRLRALALLARGELSVGELASALGQSQPRVSRHMKLLTASGLAERAPEGSWAFYRLAPHGEPGRALAEALIGAVDPEDPTFKVDLERLELIRAQRSQAAEAYFAKAAADWERVRALHLPDLDIDAAILDAAGPGPFPLMVDCGTGLGRMIRLFIERVGRAEGFDTSRQMLAIARAQLASLPSGRWAVRLGDVYDPPLAKGIADLVTVHQVLHFLPDPDRAVAQAAGLLKPGGRMVIVDFAPHGLEFLREEHAHRRLGFTDTEIARWCAAAGAPLDRTITLAPAREGALTVKIWAAQRAPAHGAEGL